MVDMKTLPIFITRNKNKAEYLSRYLGIDLAFEKVGLEEIQSLDLKEVVTHKVKQACAYLQKPVLVQDVSLEFHCLGKLPGTFIKFFVDTVTRAEMSKEDDEKTYCMTHPFDSIRKFLQAFCV
jgi:inosine/xanthosine triphosphate pyrophosphatase family protein